MKLTKEQEAEVIPIYHEWWHSYLNGDVKTYGHYLDDDYRFVGSTVAEDFLNKRDTTQFFDATADQLAGKTQKRNSKITTEYYDGVVFITELADAYLLFGDEWTFYGKFRFSSMLRKRNDGWRFIYQHFSVPDSKAQEGETIGFEQVSKENQELRDAIKRRTAELENKNRELEIEAALERVRAQSMAMQQPDDLNKVNKELLTQLKGLKVDGLTGVSIWLLDGDGMVTAWDLSSPGNMRNPSSAMVQYNPEKFDILGEPWRLLQESEDDYFVLNYSVEKIEKAINEWDEVDQDVAIGFREALANGDLKHQWNPIARHSNGILSIDLINPPLGDTKEIVTKMANAFSLAYTRFLDLQKAEAQAREAQIEMALEKVRSRTMAMQSSNELTEAASEMFSQIEGLGLNPWSCGFNIFNDDKTVISQWVSTGDGRPIEPFDTPATEGIFKRIVEQSENDEPLYIEKMEGKKLEDTYKYMASLPTLDKIFEELDAAGIELPKKQVDHAAYFKHGYLMFITYDETPEFHSIFKRFANVFEQTYTRFLDLKKAEEQAREAEVDLSLERVRSQVTAMQTSSDLFDIVVNMRKEFVSLGHTADYFWHMRWLPDSYEMSMTSDDGNRIGMVITLPKFVHDEIPTLAEWEKGDDPVYVLALDAEGAWSYIENMNTHGSYELADPNAPGKEDIEHIGGLTFIMARTSHGEIGYSLPGEVQHPPQEALDTLVRFAGVFDLAYQRFEDLQESEQQARLILEERDRLEIALNELHATQDQLVQQEKLASLGQLTAGIAHEIKNPLNFVNNFSDVSLEMIDEALEELQQIGDNEHATETAAILADIKSNLRKIHEHGTRADGIVKAMLMHSRGGNGKMEPVNLNELVKEYVNLAFHGMRAGKDPIDVDIDLQLDESVGNVPLVAEDFSRVILNLCNNAFDAMREKAKGKSEKSPFEGGGERSEQGDDSTSSYHPKLTVRTHQTEGTVTIEIEDNGPGIPDDIKDIILQPFFTTKKGTQGTGLGLSITNDIIKAHGGTLHISSSHEGSSFKILINN